MDDPAAGVTDETLRALLTAHWEWQMRRLPTLATRLGDRRFDTELPDRSPAALEDARARRRTFLARATAIDPAALDGRDRVTHALFVDELEAELRLEILHTEQWAVSTRDNPYFELAEVVQAHTIRDPEDGRSLLARLGAGERLVDETIANLRAGLAAGRVAAAEAVRRTITQLDAELARPDAGWGLAAPAADVPGVPAAALALRPAIARYREVLAGEILPRARTGDAEGIRALPDGDAAYRACIRFHLGFDREPEDLHALGLAEIARIDRALAELGRRVLGAPDLAATIARLRGDPALYFGDAPSLLAAAQDALDRANAAIPRWFGTLPRTACVISVIPPHEAPYTTIAYYQPPNPDGSKPGEYFVNTFRPEVRPRFELEALSWHEAVPGHHLQIAIAQELGELPAFRKHGGSTAYVEGWALYTERLADEMGLYSSDLDRIGMLSYDAWRASRLVVDTGLHALGWTRARAAAFMLEHTALTAENVSNEVDRYVAWPGQALAYKVGQLEFLALRAEAEQRLGERFDVRGFHDAVLGQGAVSLPVLRAQVEGWIVGAR